MSDDNEQLSAFDDVKSLDEWVEKRWQEMEKDGLAHDVKLRTARLSLNMPVKFLPELVAAAMRPRCTDRFRAGGEKAAGNGVYKPPEQFEISEVQEFLIANRKRRSDDARSELEFVKRWCASHDGWTVKKVYQEVGLAQPRAT